VGHQFAADSLAAGQRDAVEGALWSAVRVLEEHAELRLRMARRAEGAGLATVAEGFAEGAHHAHRQADAIRALLFNASPAPESLEAEAATPAPARPARGGRRATGR
jgi:two-component system chemotaxis response regulator CheB